MNNFKRLLEGSDIQNPTPKIPHSKRFKTNDGKKELELEDLQVYTAIKGIQALTHGRSGKKRKAQLPGKPTSPTATVKIDRKNKIDRQPDRKDR